MCCINVNELWLALISTEVELQLENVSRADWTRNFKDFVTFPNAAASSFTDIFIHDLS